MSELLIVFIGALVALVITGSILFSALGSQRQMSARVARIGARARPMSADDLQVRQLKLKTAKASPLLDGLAKRLMPRPGAVRARLQRTGYNISLGRYLGISVVVGLMMMIVCTVVIDLPWFAAVAAGFVAGIGLPHLYVGWLAARQRARFTALFPDAIDLMVRGLRSGLPVTETIAACGREMTAPVGPEFRRIADAVRLGQTLEDSLWDAARRVDTPEFKFFVISLSVQKETGGNLGETLANLSEILRSRKQMRLKVKAMSSEARASAMILGGLPFMMFGIIYFLSPDYEAVLFTDPRGKMLLGAVLGLMGMGVLVMQKMVKFEI